MQIYVYPPYSAFRPIDWFCAPPMIFSTVCSTLHPIVRNRRKTKSSLMWKEMFWKVLSNVATPVRLTSPMTTLKICCRPHHSSYFPISRRNAPNICPATGYSTPQTASVSGCSHQDICFKIWKILWFRSFVTIFWRSLNVMNSINWIATNYWKSWPAIILLSIRNVMCSMLSSNGFNLMWMRDSLSFPNWLWRFVLIGWTMRQVSFRNIRNIFLFMFDRKPIMFNKCFPFICLQFFMDRVQSFCKLMESPTTFDKLCYCKFWHENQCKCKQSPERYTPLSDFIAIKHSDVRQENAGMLVQRYSQKTKRWIRLNTAPINRSWFGAELIGKELIIIGGKYRSYASVNTVSTCLVVAHFSR